MDRTSGGTMTPPRDEDATCGDFAPVIPLRRRQPDIETVEPAGITDPGSRDLWNPDAPLEGLPQRPSVSTELLVRPAASTEADASGREATTALPWHARSPHFVRRRVAQIA